MNRGREDIRRDERELSTKTSLTGYSGGKQGPMSYEQTLEGMYRQQMTDYNKFTKPFIRELETESESRAGVDRAKDIASNLGEQAQGSQERQQGYSSSGLLPSMSQAMTQRRDRNVAMTTDSTVSMAHDSDKMKRRGARQDLMSIADNLQSTGIAGVSQVAAQKSQRDAAYKSQKSGFLSQAGAVVGGAIGFVAGGGPVGMAAGMALGGAIGGVAG